jgi:DNA topoisomerase-2
MWVIDKNTGLFTFKKVKFVPALYKIFDEILVNAADNKIRDPEMSKIKVDIDQEKGEISIWNNGNGIPVVIHKEEKVYIPTMIFGQLLTGSNFDDTIKKVTGGRNGYGAKLANIFSTKFKLETVDTSEGRNLKFSQTWTKNMSNAEKEKITEIKAKNPESYTQVTFTPDLERFKMDKLDDTIIEIFTKRVYDLCATCSGVAVYLNGKKIAIKNFEAYVKSYFQEEKKIMFEKVNERWQIGVALTDGDPQQVSFVNSICTTKGGKHVTYVQDQLVKKILDIVEKKNKGRKIKIKYSSIKKESRKKPHVFIH